MIVDSSALLAVIFNEPDDCFAYALAKTSGEPLLFKGNDFSRTDINAAA